MKEKYLQAMRQASQQMLIEFIYEENGEYFYVEWEKNKWRAPTKIIKLSMKTLAT